MAVAISLANVIPEHQQILAAGSKILAATRDVSSYAVKGSNSINYPTYAARSAQTQNLNGTFTVNAVNYGDDILSLTQKIGDAFDIEQHQDKQNVMRALEDTSKEVLKAMGRDCDSKIYTALIAACQAPGRNVVATSDMYADMVDLAKKLDDSSVPSEGRFFIANTADYAKLLKTKDFVRFDGVGSGEAIKSGAVGEILGFTVLKTTIASGDSVAYHRDGVVSAVQGETLLMSASIPESTQMRYSISDLFGCKVLQVTGGNSSPFCVRLGANPS